MKEKRRNQIFAKNLCSLMKEQGLTVREAANMAQVSSSVINSWRSGAQPHDFVAVKKLAQGLNVSFSFLLLGEEEIQATEKNHITEVFSDGGMLFDGYARVSIQRLVPRIKKQGEPNI